MKIINVVAISIVVLAFSIMVYFADQNKKNSVILPAKNNSEQIITTATPQVSQVESDENEPATNDKGSYIAYSHDSLTNGQNVIFFAASWCPTCRGLDNELLRERTSIPKELTILKADYDKEKELKRKYGVTYQHTLVQVDKDGALIKKWNGSRNLSEIVKELVK